MNINVEPKKKCISIIVPTWNEQGNIQPLMERIHQSVSDQLTYEIIIIDDRSTDKTREIAGILAKRFPVTLFLKKGKPGKAQSLIEGFFYAKYEIICMIDAD